MHVGSCILGDHSGLIPPFALSMQAHSLKHHLEGRDAFLRSTIGDLSGFCSDGSGFPTSPGPSSAVAT
jgi:hypothetical protein